ncbi:MAG: hypothetical protein ACRD2W_09975, partial [Acidimicrobiales bacterium]
MTPGVGGMGPLEGEARTAVDDHPPPPGGPPGVRAMAYSSVRSFISTTNWLWTTPSGVSRSAAQP